MSSVDELKSLIKARVSIGILGCKDLDELQAFCRDLAKGERRKKIVKIQKSRG